MRIPDINISTWNSIVSEHLEAKETPEAGKKCLYLKGDTIIQFENQAQAKAAGFSKMPLTKLIEITQEKMQDCQEINELQNAGQLLNSLVEKKLEKMQNPNLKEKFLRLFSSRLQTQITTIESARVFLEEIKPIIDIITPAMSERLDRELDQATSVIRSVHGKNGVYYLQTPHEPNALILKLPPEDPTKHIIADRYYSLLGYTTPNYCAVHRDSELGQKTFTVLGKLGNQYFLDHSGDREIQLYREQFDQQMQIPYATVMEMVSGTSFRQLAMEDAVLLLQDRDILQSLGEMIFYDAVIGNHDRLGLSLDMPGISTNNMTNVMLLQEGSNDRKGRRIALIDHDYNINTKNFDQICKNIKDLTDPNSNIFVMVAYGLIEFFPSPDIDMDKLFKETRVGFEKAKKTFLEVFSDESNVEKLFDIPNIQGLERSDPRLFIKIRDLIS